MANYGKPTDGPSSRAYAAVGLVVVGLLCCGPFTSVPGAILGWLEMSAIRAGQSSSQGMIWAQLGLWGGILVSIVTTIAGFFLFFLMLLSGGPRY